MWTVLCVRAPLGKTLWTRQVFLNQYGVPHGMSGTNSPYGIRSWKYLSTRVFPAGTLIASALTVVASNSDTFPVNGHDWTDRYPSIAATVAALSCQSCLIDGEVAICGNDGIQSKCDMRLVLDWLGTANSNR